MSKDFTPAQAIRWVEQEAAKHSTRESIEQRIAGEIKFAAQLKGTDIEAKYPMGGVAREELIKALRVKLTQLGTEAPKTTEAPKAKAKPTASNKKRSVTHSVQHDYIRVATKYENGVRVNLTLNHYGPKASISGSTDRVLLDNLFNGFAAMWKAKLFGSNGLFMEAVRDLVASSTCPENLVQLLKMTSTGQVHVQVKS